MPVKSLKGGIGVRPLGFGLDSAETEETEPHFNQTVLLLHGDGSEGAGNTSNLGNPNFKAFKDASTSTHAIIVNGDAYGNDFSPYYYADGYWSNFFDGTNDFITMPNVSDLNLGTGNFTIDFFIYPTDSGTNRMIIGGTGTQDYINLMDGDDIQVVFSTTGDSETFALGTTITNKWSHLAVVRKNSTTCELFLDGVSKGTNTIGSTATFNSQAGHIAKWAHNTSNRFQGYISNLRIIKGSNIYSGGNFTPSTTPITTTTGGATASEVELLTCQSNRFLDNSNNGNALTISGSPKVSTNTPFTQSKTANVGSGFFDGTGDGLTTAGSSDFAFGTSDFTLEAWAYPFGAGGTQVIIDTRYGNNNNTDNLSAMAWFGTQLGSYSGGNIVSGTDIDLIPNAWNHLAVQRISNTMYYSINGKVSSTTPTLSNNFNNTGAFPSIGGNVGLGASMYTGYLADVRIVNGTGVYGTSNFSVPTTSLTSTGSETKLLTCQYSGAVRNVGFVDDSKYNHQVIRNGDTTMGTFSPFSLEDGYWSNLIKSGDDLDVLSFNKALSNQWSFEFWYFKLDGGINVVISTDSGDQFQCAILASTVSFYYGGGSNIDVTSNYTENNWVHFLVTKDSSNRTRLFLNGVLKGTNASSTATPTLGILRIGDQRNTGSHASFGYISNVRFVIGSIPTSYQTSETSVGTSVFTSPSSFLTTTSEGATSGDVELLTCQSNIFKDNSSNNFAITVANNTPEVQPFSPFAPSRSYSKDAVGGSAYFDGTTDYIHATLPFGIGTLDMTVEFWYYPTVFADYISPFSINASGSRGEGFNIGSDANGKLKFVDTDGTNYESGNNQLQLNSWHHIAVTREGSTVRVFHQGTQLGTVSNSENWSGKIVALGARADDFSETITGYISNCNLVIGTAKYGASGYTIPSTQITAHANTQFLVNFTNAGIIDHTMKNNLESEGNTRISGQQIKFGTGSIYFDGTDDKLVISHQEYQQLGTGEFTVELFVYFTSTDQRQGFFGNDTGWYFQIYDGELEFALSTSAVIERSFSHSINQWYHLAATRDSSDDIRLFIDGTQQGAVVNSTADLRHASNDFHIGNIGPATSRLFKGGYMDEIRITKGVARYTSNFTVPTKAFANR